LGVVYHTSTGGPNKLAVVDGWALVGDGWANARPGPPLTTPVIMGFRKSPVLIHESFLIRIHSYYVAVQSQPSLFIVNL